MGAFEEIGYGEEEGEGVARDEDDLDNGNAYREYKPDNWRGFVAS